jgi:membrane protein implicated in regulation of membrane protease activity
MNTNLLLILIILVILSLALVIILLAFFASRRKDTEGKIFSVLIGITALLAGGAMEIDKVMAVALIGIVAVLIYINFKRSQKKQPDNDQEKLELFEDK